MDPITSIDNPHVKLARSLHEAKGRARARAFLVEGMRLVEAAAEASAPQLALHTPEFAAGGARAEALLRRLSERGADVRPASEKILAYVSDTVTPQGIAAIVPLPSDVSPEGGARTLDLILDEIQDPGNAGTLLRTAAAAGATRVFTGAGTVDLFSPKVVRAAAGAHFQLSIAASVGWEALPLALRSGAQVVLADARATRRYWEIDWCLPSALIVSNEARGASTAARHIATERVSIPMVAEIESLNAGVAGSIILYEALRQRITRGVTA